MPVPSDIRNAWQLNRSIDFLNHGSFGATPTVVLEQQRRYQDALEHDPIRFLAPERDLEEKLDRARRVIAGQVGADASDLALVRNATEGVNAVLRSFPFEAGDEIVVTDHAYNACRNAACFAAEHAGAVVKVARVRFPIDGTEQVESVIESACGKRTRLLMVDHVTSPTALVWPIERIVAAAKRRGIRVLVDGAHAPGMVDVDLRRIDPDYYTANHHKWWCAPKASGFLYVRPELQAEVRPVVISHAANRPRPGRSRFLAEFDWMGTYDPTAVLAVPDAIEFLSSLTTGGLPGLMRENGNLAARGRQILLKRLGLQPPAPVEMLGSMATIPLPVRGDSADDCGTLQQRLYDRHRIEVPIFAWPVPSSHCLRISAQIYNDETQYVRLADALAEEGVV